MTRLEGGLHKDAVRFANGRVISLQSLNPGLTATMFVPLPDLGLDSSTRSRTRSSSRAI